MLSLAFALAAASVADQMAPARSGMLQCQSPDVLFKTCLSLSKVVQTAPDRFRFETEILVDPDGPVIATMTSTATVIGSSVCDVTRLSEIENWNIKVGGSPASQAQADRLRSKARRNLAPISGQTICTRIIPNEQGMEMVQGSIGGKRVPAADYPMKWVGPQDGWTVAP